MAIAFDAIAQGGDVDIGSNATVTQSFTLASGAVLLVWVHHEVSFPTSVVWNGTEALTVLQPTVDHSSGANERLSFWMLHNPTSGTHNVVITFAASVSGKERLWTVMSWTGVERSSLAASHHPVAHGLNPTSVRSVAGNTVVCVTMSFSGSTLISNQTPRGTATNAGGGSNWTAAGSTTASSTSTQMSFANASTANTLVGVALVPTGGDGGDYLPVTRLTDNFSTYSNGALPTVSGGSYSKPTDWPNPIAIASHLAAGTASGDNACYLTSWAGSTTFQWAEVTIATADDFLGPTVYNDATGNFFFLDCRPLSGGLYFFRVTSNQSFSQLAAGFSVSIAVGDVCRLEIDIDNLGYVVLSAYVNGALVVAYPTGGGVVTSGKPGLRIWNTTTRLSRFSAGDFAQASGVALGGGSDVGRTRLGLEIGVETQSQPRLGGGSFA